jgi:hypothetical protein
MLQKVTFYRDDCVRVFMTDDWQKDAFAAPTPNRITVDDINGNRLFDSTVERMLAAPFGSRQVCPVSYDGNNWVAIDPECVRIG